MSAGLQNFIQVSYSRKSNVTDDYYLVILEYITEYAK